MGRVNGYLICAGKWHDFDFARLQLLEMLSVDEQIRVKVGQHYEDVEAICASDFLVTYTCDVRPSERAQQALAAWVEGGGRWLALHGTNSAIDPSPNPGVVPFPTPRAFPKFVDILGSQFISHPTIQPYQVTVSPGAEHDPLVQGIGAFETDDELYLCDLRPGNVNLLETRWTGTEGGFEENHWPDDDPRPVLYRRRVGAGEVVYFTLGHCRSRWDMIDPPFNGRPWPTTDRGSWEVPEFREILRRAITWAADLQEVPE